MCIQNFFSLSVSKQTGKISKQKQSLANFFIMENLLETYKEEDDEEDKLSVADPLQQETPELPEEATPATVETKLLEGATPASVEPELPEEATPASVEPELPEEATPASVEPDSQLDLASEDISSDEPPSDDTKRSPKRQQVTEDEGASPKEEPENDDSVSGNGTTKRSPKRQKITEEEGASPKEEAENEDSVSGNGNGNGIGTPEASISKAAATATTAATSSKKSKKKSNNVWLTKTVRKGKKKNNKNGSNNGGHVEDAVMITPVPRFPDKNDDSADMNICLSKVYKAEKVELSEDRMSAGSTKGYRMVRATRGVCEGSWYFEIKLEHLGETGHTRLGWSTEKSDLQAPVGFDGNSFGYRDIDGSKVHKALREKYGDEGYKEGDVIGFYINLPDGGLFAPKPPQMVLFKGQRYVHASDPKDDPPKVVPGSEISFFKNGVCQGVAFKDLFGGRYYPAASMYTLPDQPNCLVKFNFGPEFDFFPENFDGRPVPRPMVEVPYHGFDGHVESGAVEEKKQ